MQAFPIDYVEPVFRPPSEAHSLILPVTNGCSWNHCSFCEMYTAPQKKFRARDEAEVVQRGCEVEPIARLASQHERLLQRRARGFEVVL